MWTQCRHTGNPKSMQKGIQTAVCVGPWGRPPALLPARVEARFFTVEEGHAGRYLLLPRGLLGPPTAQRRRPQVPSPAAQPHRLPSPPPHAHKSPPALDVPQAPCSPSRHTTDRYSLTLCVRGWGTTQRAAQPGGACEPTPGPACDGGGQRGGHRPGQHPTPPSSLGGQQTPRAGVPAAEAQLGDLQQVLISLRMEVAAHPARASLQAGLGPEPLLRRAPQPCPPLPGWAFNPPDPQQAGLSVPGPQGRSCQRKPVAQGHAAGQGEWAVSGLFTVEASLLSATGSGGGPSLLLAGGGGCTVHPGCPTARPSSLLLPKALSFLLKKPKMSLFGASVRPEAGVGAR